MDLYRLGISEISALLERREISSREVTASVFSRIGSVEDRIKSFVTLTGDQAMGMAEKADREYASGHRKTLSGMPIAIKDNMCTKGVQTTCSSKILQSFIPPYESTATSKLLEQGYVLIGKTNLDEFAMGSSTENSGFFTTRNPWDTERIPRQRDATLPWVVIAALVLTFVTLSQWLEHEHEGSWDGTGAAGLTAGAAVGDAEAGVSGASDSFQYASMPPKSTLIGRGLFWQRMPPTAIAS